MDIGLAIKHLRNGRKVSRKSWYGKGLYLIYANNIIFEDKIVNECILIYHPATNKYSMWQPSIGDTLGNDWEVGD